MSFHSKAETIQKYFENLVRGVTFFFLATTHFNAVPSRLRSIAVQACLSSFKLSCSRCKLFTSTQVSMQPCKSFLNSFGLLKVFLDLLPPLSLDYVFLVSNVSTVLFINSQTRLSLLLVHRYLALLLIPSFSSRRR